MSRNTIEMTEAFVAFLRERLPEHAAELARVVAENRITFHVDDDAERIEFTSGSRPSGPQPITVGRKGLGRLWAHAFSSFLGVKLFDERRQGQAGPTRFPASEWQLQAANEALTWAMRTDVNLKYARRYGMEYTLPTTPESPFVTLRAGSVFVISTAREIFSYALAYLLLHEIAHIVNRDTKADEEAETLASDDDRRPEKFIEPIHQEKRADQWAAERLLGSDGVAECVRLQRRMGVAIASLWLTTIHLYVEHLPGLHPPAWDRLYETLNPHLEEVDAIWGFVVISVMNHLQNAERLPQGIPDLGPDRESVNLLLDHISRMHEQR
jgi:hypothetical protein